MECIANPILEGNFYASSKRRQPSHVVRINGVYLGVFGTNDSSTKTVISIRDIIGCRCTRRRKRIDEKCDCHSNKKNIFSILDSAMDESHTNDTSVHLRIYAYVLKKLKLGNGSKRERLKITLRFRSYTNYEDNLKEAVKWRETIKGLIQQTQWSSPLLQNVEEFTSNVETGNRILIVLNPRSGPGKAREIFQEQIMPILHEADLMFDLHITKARNDARNFIKNGVTSKWKRGIVTIGGDGVLFEVMNGIMERPDWKQIINTIPLAIIPGGSGNGLAKSLSVCTKEPYDRNPVLISTLSLIKGFPTAIDLVRIETHSEVVFSFLSLGWGLIADIDIESERLRMIGSPRFTIWSMARLIGLRTYAGRLSFKRVPQERVKKAMESEKYVRIQIEDEYLQLDEAMVKKSTNFAEMNSNSSFDMDSISLDTGCDQCDAHQVKRAESFYSLNSFRSAYHSDRASSSYLSLAEVTKSSKRTVYGPSSQLPPINKPVPNSWEVYQGEFIMVHATYQSHLAADVHFAPHCKPNDGIIWLVVVKSGISRVNLLQFLLGMSHGTHLKYPHVEMIPVFAFRLEPLCEGSHIVVDGELLERSSTIQAEIFQGMVSLFNKPAA